jgi:hypothetical protein
MGDGRARIGDRIGARLGADEGAKRLIALSRTHPDSLIWFRALEDSEPRQIIAAIGSMGTIGVNAGQYDAYRDAARAVVEMKLTDELTRSSSRLACVGWCVTAVVGLLPFVLSGLLWLL